MPPRKGTNWGMYGKMTAVGLGICIGGPLLVMYLSPTEEELFLKYNPDLQRRSLANRAQNQEDFELFVGKLKGYSKDSRNIWDVAAEDEKKLREKRRLEQEELMGEVRRRKEEMRREQVVEPGVGAGEKKEGWAFWR